MAGRSGAEGERLAAFQLRGRVIDADQQPARGVRVAAYDDDPLLDPDDHLGDTVTDARGRFALRFDTRDFAPFLAALEGTPDVFLVLKDARGREVGRTRVTRTGREIEYHIRLAPHRPDRRAPDLYGSGLARMRAGADDVAAFERDEYRLNLDLLRNPDLPPEERARLERAVAWHAERVDNLANVAAALQGFTTMHLERAGLGTIGYDGPQVPRHAWREAYTQAIAWPRSEAFPWA